MGSSHVKLYEIWTCGSGGDVVLRKKFTDDGRTYGRCTDGRTTDKDRPQ